MKTVEETLKEELEKLKKIVEQGKKRLQSVPDGHLRITKKRDKMEYYYKNNDIMNKNGRYMKKSEEKLVKEIAQRDYDVKLIKVASERINLLENFLTKYKKTSLKKLYEENGIYMGVNLFFTHETGKMALNTRVLDGLIKELFC